jgi:hypothetical protein
VQALVNLDAGDETLHLQVGQCCTLRSAQTVGSAGCHLAGCDAGRHFDVLNVPPVLQQAKLTLLLSSATMDVPLRVSWYRVSSNRMAPGGV